MSVLIGHASIDENGKISGGTAGDQTGKEVCTRTWYSKPWDFMAIHPSATVREKHASCCEAACANSKIGYDQVGRNTLHPLAVAAGFDYSKITTACECDCSSFQNSLAVASGSGATYSSNGWTTQTMKTELAALGYKIITDSTYLTSADYCVRGAIYVKSSSHTVCGLTDGSKASATLIKAGISSGNTTYKGTGIGTATALTTMNVRSGAGTSYSTLGTITKGTSVEVLEVLSSGWYKIVWVEASCGYAYTSNTTKTYYTYTANASTSSTGASTATSASSTSTSSSSTKKTATEAAKSYSKSLAGTYTVTASSLNVRDGAGTGKSILIAIPKGTQVKNYGYYTSVSNVKWLYIQFTLSGVTYTGFASSEWLSKS